MIAAVDNDDNELVCPSCKSTKIYKHYNENICGICSYLWRNDKLNDH